MLRKTLTFASCLLALALMVGAQSASHAQSNAIVSQSGSIALNGGSFNMYVNAYSFSGWTSGLVYGWTWDAGAPVYYFGPVSSITVNSGTSATVYSLVTDYMGGGSYAVALNVAQGGSGKGFFGGNVSATNVVRSTPLYAGGTYVLAW